MIRFAVGELGLKPWEFKDMTFKEYQLYAHGYFLRQDRATVPIRRLYTLLHNVNAQPGKQLLSADAIMRNWPLLIDVKSTDLLTADEKKARLEKAKELTKKHKLQAGGNKQ